MRNIILLGITSLLTDVSSEMIYPVLPVFLVMTLGASPAVLGLIEGTAESLASLIKVFSGYFSDRCRLRKPFAIAGYASSALGKFFLYLAGSWHLVLLGRGIDRFGKGIRTAPRDALIAESSSEHRRGEAFGLHRAMDTWGAALGVGLAYLLVARFKGDLREVFLLSLISALLGVVVLFFVKEAKAERIVNTKEKPRFCWYALDKRLRLFLVFSFIFTLGNSSNQFLLLRSKELGSSLTLTILFYLLYNIIYGLVSYPASWLSDHLGRKKILVLGYLIYAGVYFGFAVNNSLSVYWFLFAVYGLYSGFTERVEKALLMDLSGKELRATVIGLHATIVGIGLLPASLLAGLLWKFLGASIPFYFGAIMSLVSAAGFWIVLKDL
ncbi:MAG: MFS transporter [Candidatus Omnitrophica bacterium]|nr:MFS transporter [Candidatus Omnitrophota bacterium]